MSPREEVYDVTSNAKVNQGYQYLMEIKFEYSKYNAPVYNRPEGWTSLKDTEGPATALKTDPSYHIPSTDIRFSKNRSNGSEYII